MTQFLTLKSKTESQAETPCSSASQVNEKTVATNSKSLLAAVKSHSERELASFHTPGHKSRELTDVFSHLQASLFSNDLTELDGLDDLTDPKSALAQIEERAARLWQAGESLISLGGASAGLAASLIAIAASDTRKKVLVPRNAHRSVVNGLILSGLEPQWYEPEWDSDWGVFGAVSEATIENHLRNDTQRELAAIVLVSPTYAGTLSDIGTIAHLARSANLTLVVDEAHGAHLLPDCDMPLSAVPHADITVHSLHKTLGGLTQTGMIHLRQGGRLDRSCLRAALSLIHSSSPSYPLMLSIEHCIDLLERSEGKQMISALNQHRDTIWQSLTEIGGFEIYRSPSGTDPAHVLIRSLTQTSDELHQFLSSRGIFAEARLGDGLLLMLGIGSRIVDIDLLATALCGLSAVSLEQPRQKRRWQMPPTPEQFLPPRRSFFMPSQMVPAPQAAGRISQACIAPCPLELQ